MFETRILTGGRQLRRTMGTAVGMSLLLVAGVACGGSQSSSPASTQTKPAQQSVAESVPSPATAGVAARTSPTPEQVADVITQIKQRIVMSFEPSEIHVRAFGDAACTAFDENRTAAEARTMVMQAASQLPSVTISTEDADFAVRTAVTLFCPGYSDRLAS